MCSTLTSLSLSLSLSLSCSLVSQTIIPLACRVAVVTAWKEKNTTIQAALDAVMSTDLFKTAQSHCQAEIEMYNRASGVVCLLDKESGYDYEFTYNSFWGSDDGYYFDGDYDLATMFPQTANFTKIGDFAPCLADCYTGLGNGCDLYKSQGWMTNYGKVPTSEYCDMHWAAIDNGYNAIKLCAAQAVANPSIDNTQEEGKIKEDIVSAFQIVQATEGECAYKYCNKPVADAIESTICPNASPTSGSSSNNVRLFYSGVSPMGLGVVMTWLLAARNIFYF